MAQVQPYWTSQDYIERMELFGDSKMTINIWGRHYHVELIRQTVAYKRVLNWMNKVKGYEKATMTVDGLTLKQALKLVYKEALSEAKKLR